MCYEDKDRPPLPPGSVGEYQSQDLTLTASDGNQFMAYLATPKTPARAQIIIYPDVRGLHGFYKDLARRFAEIGVTALAIDYFGRTAGLSARDETFDFRPHVQALQIDSIMLDVRAALDYLHTTAGPDGPVFVVGFCMGGSLSLLSGAYVVPGLAGLIAFYAGFGRDFGGKGTALDNAIRIAYPVLGLFGGADQGIPAEQVRALDAALDQAGVTHDVVIYPDAPHSFFDRRAEEYADASADAWRRILAFIGDHAASV